MSKEVQGEVSGRCEQSRVIYRARLVSFDLGYFVEVPHFPRLGV